MPYEIFSSRWSERYPQPLPESTRKKSLDTIEWGSEVTVVDQMRRKILTKSALKVRKEQSERGKVWDWVDHLEPVFDPDSMILTPTGTLAPAEEPEKQGLSSFWKQNGPGGGKYPPQVYAQYLEEVFKFPDVRKHSDCTMTLKPMHKYCVKEKCPTLFLANYSRSLVVSKHKRSRERRKKFSVKTLCRKLKSFREKLLGRKPKPLDTSSGTSKSQKKPFKSSLRNSSVTISADPKRRREQRSKGAKMEKVHQKSPYPSAPNTSAVTPKTSFGRSASGGYLKNRSSISQRSWHSGFTSLKRLRNSLPQSPFTSKTSEQPSVDESAYTLLSPGIYGPDLDEQLLNLQNDADKIIKPLLRQFSVIQPPARSSFFVIPQDLDNTLGGLTVIIDSDVNVH